MRLRVVLLGGVLLLSLFPSTAKAQGPAGVGSESAGPPVPEHRDSPWQIEVGYQYNRVNLIGSPFSTHGVNVSFARFLKSWLAVEAGLGSGFLGKTGQTTNPPNLDAKSIFVGGGPRVVLHNHTRFEPWAHALVGVEHFRFSQTAGVLGTNTALAAPLGGGVDIYLRPYVAVRGEADAVETRFFSANQRSFQAIGGLVFNF